MYRCICCLTLVALAAGCGTDTAPPVAKKATAPVPADANKLVLASEPAGVKGVIDVRKDAKDGDEVVVAGQIGGAAKPFTEGRASFLMVDPSLVPTEGCETPWDFCEMEKKAVAAARLSVKFVDADGKTLHSGAKELFGVKELSGVVVKGKVSRDDKDNVVVVASGIHVRPEKK
ncbi:MAG: hypothetical protein ACRC33_27615 [Gemmataceae bacterium]